MAVLHKYQVVRKRLRGTFYEERAGLKLTAKNFECRKITPKYKTDREKVEL